ncbi:MAG: ribosome biogenesis GTPase YlqF [Bacilli bacterium]
MGKDMYQKRKERQESKNNNENSGVNKSVINWYPGHMAKAKREILDKIRDVDCIIEVIDARIPISSHIKEIDDFLGKKNIIIVLNKYDLCDKEISNKFIDYYIKKGYIVITSDSKNSNDYKKLLVKIDGFMESANIKRNSRGLLNKKAKAIVVGVPNAGKSTLINKLVGKTINKVANKPGVTRNINVLRINDKVDLIDTPGILWPRLENDEQALNLASMSIIKEEIIPIDRVGIHILNKLNKYYKDILIKEFKIDNFDNDDLIGMYELINNYKHFPLYDGEVDYDRINLYIINLIKSEHIKNITFDRP